MTAPGPWVAKNHERDEYAWDVYDAEGVILFRGMWSRDGAEAKLAAAAPELLEAAKHLWKYFETLPTCSDCVAAKAAIARAEGK